MEGLIENRKRQQYIQWLLDATEKPIETKSYPPLVYIEPTNGCNLHCRHCARYTMKREVTSLSIGNFTHILSQIQDFVRVVYLFKQGEPLLNINVPYFIRQLREKNIYVVLNTNATLLSEEVARKVLESDLNVIEFSVDSWKRDTYQKIREGADFERVINNIVAFLKLKQQINQETITRVRLVEQDLNRSELLATVKLLKKFPFDDIRINKLLNFFGNIQGEIIGKDIIESKKDVCSYPWKVVAINSDGNVTCILDYDNIYSYGNVFKKDFKDIWNDAPIKKIRKAFLSKSLERLKSEASNYCYICNARLKEDQKQPTDFIEAFCTYGYLYPDYYMPHLRMKRSEEEQKIINEKYSRFEGTMKEFLDYTDCKISL